MPPVEKAWPSTTPLAADLGSVVKGLEPSGRATASSMLGGVGSGFLVASGSAEEAGGPDADTRAGADERGIETMVAQRKTASQVQPVLVAEIEVQARTSDGPVGTPPRSACARRPTPTTSTGSVLEPLLLDRAGRSPDERHLSIATSRSELVGPVADLVALVEIDARAVLRAAVRRFVCHGGSPSKRGNANSRRCCANPTNQQQIGSLVREWSLNHGHRPR